MLSKDNLPTSVDELQTLCLQLQNALVEKDEHLKEKDAYIEHLEERLNLLLSKRYQSQSEQLNQLQAQLFDESELEQAIQELQEELAAAAQKKAAASDESKKSAPKQRPKREALPAHLRRVEIVIDVSGEDKQMMGDEWELIGYDQSEQLAVRPREYYIKSYRRAKYIKKDVSKSTSTTETAIKPDTIKIAPRPALILPKSIADASLLAEVIAGKFIDALSFYRKHKVLAREGIDIGYSTICDWPIQLYAQLQPIKRLLYEELPKQPLWHMDETTLQVLNEPNRKNTTTSYLWGIRAGPPGKEIILFHYDTSKSYEALAAWISPYLKDFRGAIITDEAKAYNKLKRLFKQIKAHGGCWFHLRRKFVDAVKGRKHTSDAHKLLKLIATLNKIDTGLTHLYGEQKKQARQKQLRPQMDIIKQFLDDIAPKYPNDGLMKIAIQYALNNWEKFTACLEYPELPLDNNIMEQAIRPFTIGRRNWLFSGGPRGAEASAFLYSLVETAKACGWEPKAYLEILFERFPFAKNDDERRALLPMFLKPSK